MSETIRVPAQDVVVGDFIPTGNAFEKVTKVQYTDDQVIIDTGHTVGEGVAALSSGSVSVYNYDQMVEILDDEPVDMEKFHSNRSRSEFDSF